jgi:hypothetical protein
MEVFSAAPRQQFFFLHQSIIIFRDRKWQRVAPSFCKWRSAIATNARPTIAS